jgi:F0F1-type ATP synthase membrane subunit c/vacuolar-type H+-ATPase subunit K
MRIVREEPDDLRAEVGQSLVLLGLAAVIVLIGLVMGMLAL